MQLIRAVVRLKVGKRVCAAACRMQRADKTFSLSCKRTRVPQSYKCGQAGSQSPTHMKRRVPRTPAYDIGWRCAFFTTHDGPDQITEIPLFASGITVAEDAASG